MISTCANCLTASNHQAEIKINYCFLCGYKINYIHKDNDDLRIHKSKAMYEEMMFQLNNIRNGLKGEKENKKYCPVDWDLAAKELKRSE